MLAVAGCGSSSDSDSTSANAPASSSSSAPASTAASSTKSSTSSAKPKSGPQKVEIKDFDYSPRMLVVAVGTKVTWTNTDPANHTVTFDTGNKKDLGNQSTGSKVSFVFKKPGTYAYHCDYHPNMHGKVIVR